MKVFIVSTMLLAVAMAAPGVMDNKVQQGTEDASFMSRFVGNCADSGDVTTCLAIKGITALNRAARSNNLEIVSGISFVR